MGSIVQRISLYSTYLTPSTSTNMATKGPVEAPGIGFDFSNFARNQHLGRQLGGLPKGRWWFTTISLPSKLRHSGRASPRKMWREAMSYSFSLVEEKRDIAIPSNNRNLMTSADKQQLRPVPLSLGSSTVEATRVRKRVSV